MQATLEVFQDILDMPIYLQGPHTDQKPPQFLSFDVVLDRMSSGSIDPVVRKHVTPASINTLINTSGTTGILICFDAK